MSKRRKVDTLAAGNEVFGNESEALLYKPVYNRDIPSSAKLVDINVISNRDTINKANITVKSSNKKYKDYGDILLYEFPKCEQTCPLTALTEKTMLPTNEIYDVDFFCQMKPQVPIISIVNADEGSTGETSERVTALTKDASDIVGKWGTVLQSTTLDLNEKDYYEFQDRQRSYIFFAMSDSKRKEFGDWIEKYKSGDGSTTYWLGHKTEGATPWFFDRFCKEMKPMFARHARWVTTNTNLTSTAYYKRTGSQPNSATSPHEIPFEGTVTSLEGRWEFRDFHRRMNQENLTPTDTYATNLLIGSLCGGLNAVQQASFKIYYSPTKVNASTLYFQQNKDFQRPVWQGDRIEYGAEDFFPDADARIGKSTQVLEVAKFQGVITSSIGKTEYFENGKKAEISAKTNILQDTGNTSWY